MVFWITAGLIALVVVAILIVSMRRSSDRVSPAASDIAVYRDQLAEVDRDLARGALGEADAEAVRIEVSRRLLDADKRDQASQTDDAGAFWPAAVFIAVVLLGGTWALYSRLGAPGYADQPLKARLAALDEARQTRPNQAAAEAEARANWPAIQEADENYQTLVAELRKAVADRPNDTQGLAFLFRHEANLGNFDAARAAQQQLVASKGDAATLEDRQTLLDAMVFAAGGYISPEAETVLLGVLEDQPTLAPARYYEGLLYTQLGRPDRAFPIWRVLLESSPPNAPWVPVIRAEIEEVAALAGVRYQAPELRGPSADDIAAAADMTDEDRQAMIQNMVEGLSARLADEGGPPQDWARLIGALGVLGQSDRARAIADEAEQVFANDPDALSMMRQAREGLPE